MKISSVSNGETTRDPPSDGSSPHAVSLDFSSVRPIPAQVVDDGSPLDDTVAGVPYPDHSPSAQAVSAAMLALTSGDGSEPAGASTEAPTTASPTPSRLRALIVRGVIWRSGSQMLAQIIAWAVTFIVIRVLRPEDYGLVAMTQTVLALLSMMAGGSFANALVRRKNIDVRDIGQVLGMLILVNGALIAFQYAIAPLVAQYYRQPQLTAMLRVQTLIYLAMPAFSLGTALLAQKLDYRRQAIANMTSVIVSAGVALFGVMTGLGIWTLVLAPIAMFWSRGIVLFFAARLWVRPVFDFRGAGETLRFGGAVIASQLLWFVQSQSDVFIGGRHLDADHLGYYTTALFLTQIITGKILPAINDVAYSAYARLHHEGVSLSGPFVQSVHWVMMIVLPLYFGLAMTAEPLTLLVLGDHWRGSAPIITILALAMPCYALQLLFAPATNALGRPRLAVYSAMAGAVVMPLGYGAGIAWGVDGLAAAWLISSPLLLILTAAIALPVMRVHPLRLVRAVLPPLFASAVMLIPVAGVRNLASGQTDVQRLALEVLVGAVTYLAILWTIDRQSILEFIATVRPRVQAD